MSTQNVAYQDFGSADGLISLGNSDVWYCAEHEVTMKAGVDCAFCAHDQIGDLEFDRWLSTAARNARARG
jgi:hypothetical protein